MVPERAQKLRKLRILKTADADYYRPNGTLAYRHPRLLVCGLHKIPPLPERLTKLDNFTTKRVPTSDETIWKVLGKMVATPGSLVPASFLVRSE